MSTLDVTSVVGLLCSLLALAVLLPTSWLVQRHRHQGV